jgi:guanosine-3',5'-bis(diphosphate) 3'-pyrophosphohydrolase
LVARSDVWWYEDSRAGRRHAADPPLAAAPSHRYRRKFRYLLEATTSDEERTGPGAPKIVLERPVEPEAQAAAGAPAAARDGDGTGHDAPAPEPDPALTAPEAEATTPAERARAGGPARPRQSGVRAVLARLPMFESAPAVPDLVQPLLATVRRHSPKADVKQILRAYDVAADAHAEQRRSSGEPYIVHPVGVAEVLAELGLDTATIVAALLHDVVEDSDITVDDLAAEFGAEAAALVDGVTKLDAIQTSSREEQQAESLRKMFIAMASDSRVLLIKLADRLHNMRTIHHLGREKQKRIAEETLSIYAPLAHRLGMQQFKWQLEDLAFSTLHPKRYDEIKSMVAERQPERDRFLDRVVADVEEELRAVKIRAEVTGRPKHYYSIYEKMVLRGREFSEIYDLVGIRVLVDNVKDCYAALGTLHALWRPIPGRFKDYIAMPKFNLYQSLHTTVVGPEGKPIEVQIRTKSMHRTAEFGIAAHWKYKQSKRAGDAVESDDAEKQWLSQMLDWQSETRDSGEFLRNMRLDLYADEVFVFTPAGDVVALPRGSTPVDFAYSIHTEVGHRTIGARVNDRLVALEYELRNGETVEILTSKAQDAAPSRDWLDFVGSSRARSKIKQWFSRERREDAIDKGRDELQRALAKQGAGWKKAMAAPELKAVAQQLNYVDVEALYRAIGERHVAASTVVQHLMGALTDDADEPEAPLPPPTLDIPARASEAVVVEGSDDVWVTLARCCTPVPRDEILGFVTRGRGVSVHRTDCPNAEDLKRNPERLLPVRWDTTAPATFRVTVQVEALDRKHLLRDITTVLGDLHVNILSAQVTTQRDRVAYLRFTFELADIAHLDHILVQMRRIEAVFDAYRVVPRATKVGAGQSHGKGDGQG